MKASTVRPGRGLETVGREPASAERELERVGSLAAGCRACELWERATQTVFGRGPVDAPVMLVGEQPGDREDREGEPFVGPAGAVLDRALATAGLRRERVFVTNVVKHFRWRPSGKRRLHERPTRANVRTCRPWLDAELGLVRPVALVCLGATAAHALVGSDVRVSAGPMQPLNSPLAALVIATIHPSSILRARGGEAREAALDRLVRDLRFVADFVASA